ncbi:MAG TPA: thioredoxin [Vicinamibacteria bacterium]
MNKNVHVVGDADWNVEVLQASELVLVDFWAEWCPPCRKLSPVIDALADEYAGRVKVVKLNVDESPEVAGRYSIFSIPTLLLFKDGEVVEQLVGFRPKDDLKTVLDAHQAVPGQAAAAS